MRLVGVDLQKAQLPAGAWSNQQFGRGRCRWLDCVPVAGRGAVNLHHKSHLPSAGGSEAVDLCGKYEFRYFAVVSFKPYQASNESLIINGCNGA